MFKNQIKLTKETECPVCGKDIYRPWLIKRERKIYRCSNCDHIFVQVNQSIRDETRRLYDGGTLFVDDVNYNYYFDESIIESMRIRLNWVNKFCKRGYLLDIGAGFGHFLKVAQDIFDAQGIEISAYAVDWSIKNLKVNNKKAAIEGLADTYQNKFDIITMWDVIEHLDCWEEPLSKIAKLLKRNGLFFLSTPNSSSLMARIMGRYWYFLDPIQHLNIFNKQNLVKILKENNFSIIGITSLGRYYSGRYIMDRLNYLNDSSGISKLICNTQKKLTFINNCKFYICFGDIIGICARKNKEK